MDKCREEFEQYIRSESGFTADFQIGCNGQYKSDLMHFMFITWQHQQKQIDETTALYVTDQHQKIRYRTIAQDALDRCVLLEDQLLIYKNLAFDLVKKVTEEHERVQAKNINMNNAPERITLLNLHNYVNEVTNKAVDQEKALINKEATS